MTESALGFGSSTRSDDEVTTAQRIAGGVLILNAAAVLGEVFVFPPDPGMPNPIFSACVDILLGGLLMAGRVGAVPWVKVRVILGAIVFTGLHALRGDPFTAGIQVCFSLGLMALLFGDPGKLRIALGLGAVALLMALEGAGLQQQMTGRNSLTPLVMRVTGGIEPIADVVSGDQVAFTLESPGVGWHRRPAESARADNPLADTWLIHPETDAHLLVIAEELPEPVVFPLDELTSNVLLNAKTVYPDFVIRSQKRVPAEGGAANLIEATALVEGTKMRFLYGVYSFEGYAFQLIGFAAEPSYVHVRDDLRKAILSFAFAPSEG
jgi:hypothetical protein